MAEAIASLTADAGALTSAAADGNTLVVTTSLPPADLRTVRLFRSIFEALGAPAFAEREVLTIPDADLRTWERPAGDVRAPRLDTIDRDDRRWWWAAAIVLLALEGWLRRARRDAAAQTGDVETARVA
jgi:hypothetical protein